MKRRAIKLAIAACLIGLAIGLRGPDGDTVPWVDTALTVVAAMCGALVLVFAVILWMICRDAQHDIELSAERDAAGSTYEPRGIPPHDPPREESEACQPTTTSTSQDLEALYLEGMKRGRAIVERAHRLRPANEVCGTAE